MMDCQPQAVGLLNAASVTGNLANVSAFSATGIDHLYGIDESSALSAAASMMSIRGRSRVWNEFSVTGDGNKVTCHHCGDSLSYSNSHSTSSMLKHLKRRHSMDLYPPMSAHSDEVGDVNALSALMGQDGNQDESGRGNSTNASKSKAKAKKRPQRAQEIKEPSIQHAPLIFKDPCVRMRWTDHTETFVRSFTNLYSDEIYTDVTIVVDKKHFKAHRIILSSASEFFDETFRTISHGQHPVIFLKDTDPMEFRLLMDFIYKGEVAIPPTLIPGLVKVGSELRVKGLSDFVWNETLANNIFQQAAAAQQQQQMATENPQLIQPMQPNQLLNPEILEETFPEPSQVAPAKSTPTQTLRQPIQAQSMITPQHTQGNRALKTYSRIANVQPANNTNSGNMSGVSGNVVSPPNGLQQIQTVTGNLNGTLPSLKRIKLAGTETQLSPQIVSVSGTNANLAVGGDGGGLTGIAVADQGTLVGLPDSVLMLASGEAILANGQGGMGMQVLAPAATTTTVMGQPDISAAVHHGSIIQQVAQQFQPVITSIASQAQINQQRSQQEIEQQELVDEVVYSITKIPNSGGGQGNEVLMQHSQVINRQHSNEGSIVGKRFI